MRDHIEKLEDWPTPGTIRWLNAYHMLYQRYLELDDPAIKIPSEPMIVMDTHHPEWADARWQEHVEWAKTHGIADEVLAMLKRSPSVPTPGAMETLELRPWAPKR